MNADTLRKLKGTIAGENKLLLLSVPEKEYNNTVKNISFEISRIYKKTCFVALNKPYAKMIEEFKQKKIDIKNFFFIDAITKQAEKNHNVSYISSPSALTEMEIEVNKVLRAERIDCFIIDSVSTLLIYGNESDIIRFIHDMVNLFRSKDVSAIFFVLKKDAAADVIKDMNMFIDEVITV